MGSNGTGKRKQCTFVKALAMLKNTANRRKTFKMLVTGPVTSAETLSGTVKQGKRVLADSAGRESAFCSEGSTTTKER